MNTWGDIAAAESVALGFLAILLTSAGGAFLGLRTLNSTRDDQLLIGAISMVVGPIFVSFFAAQILRFAPGLPGLVYIFAPLALVVAAGLTLRLTFGAPSAPGTPPIKSAQPRAVQVIGIAAGIATAATIFGFFVFTLFTPVHGNDALEYARAAQIIAELRSMADYPFLDSAITGGLVTPWTHPPGHITLLALAEILQGSAVNAPAMKVVAPYFAVSQAALLIAFVGHGGGRYAGYVAALLTLGAPTYFGSTLLNHVDPMRIAAFTAAVAATWLVLKRETLGCVLIAGIACAASGFTHSIGVLTLFLTIPAYFILSQTDFKTRFRNVALISALGVITVVPTLLVNLQALGGAVQDVVPAWTLPNVRFDEFVALERGLESPFRRLVFGVFRAFTEPELFGWTLWAFALSVGLFALQFFIRRVRLPSWNDFVAASKDQSTICVLIVGGFFAMLLLSVAADSVTAIKNARYSMTVLPLAAAAAARLLMGQIVRPRG